MSEITASNCGMNREGKDCACSILWIIVLLSILKDCGGCGCDGDSFFSFGRGGDGCGCESIIIILLLLSCCGKGGRFC